MGLVISGGGTPAAGSITSAMIANDSIVNADIKSDAAIAVSKLVGALPGPTYKVGEFITAPYVSAGAGSTVASVLYLHPIYIPRSVTIDQLAVYVTTGAGATTARLGIFADDGSGRPGAVVVDGGTTATTASSAAAVTGAISTPLAAGVYWGGVQVEGGTPALQAFANHVPLIPRVAVSNANQTGLQIASRTGALATAVGATFSATTQAPILFLRVG